MFIENEIYKVKIIRDETFTLNSTDNKPYHCVFNPDDMKRSDYYKVLSITVEYFDSEKRIALIGSLFGADEDIALLDGNDLIILMNTTITVINCQTLSISLHKAIAKGGIYFSMHRFDNGFVIYGELEILKLSFEFEKEWDFSGADIFVTHDGSNPFHIENDTIHLLDWEGRQYVVDRFGNELTNHA